MRLHGTVVGGRGLASAHLAEISEEIAKALAAHPAPGSLNIVLDRPLELDLSAAVLSVNERRFFWAIRINGLPCLAYRWRTCPLHIVELISDVPLRKSLGLTDRSTVSLETADSVPIPFARRIAWAILWAGRRRLYYSSPTYVGWTKRFARLRHHAVQRTVTSASQAESAPPGA